MSRRARPTLRVLREDLGSDWGDPRSVRVLAEGDLSSMQPLSALPHPILKKASECFGSKPGDDSFVMPIVSVTSETFLEIKSGQWRAGVWIDEDACWVVAAGLAKGDHQDHDDFYQRLGRAQGGGVIGGLLPTPEDRELLKRENAARKVTVWQQGIQTRLIDAIAAVCQGGTAKVDVASLAPDAPPDALFGTVELTVAIFEDDDDSIEDVVVEFDIADRWKNTQLRWHMTMGILAAISPPEQGWDVAGGDMYSNLLPLGTLATRVQELRQMTDRGEIATSTVGTEAHYAHRRNIAECSVEGKALRAICGVYFVPRQDPQAREVCPTCEALHREFPKDD